MVETAADLTIRWTNGATEMIQNVAADQLVLDVSVTQDALNREVIDS